MDTDKTMSDDEKLAKAELLREKTGASFMDVREALEASNYDMLDAIVWLEEHGKVTQDGVHAASYTTAAAPEDATSVEMAKAQNSYEQATRPNGLVKALNRMLEWLKGAFKKSMDIRFVIEHKGRQVMTMPLLALIVLILIPPVWMLIPLILISLFFDVRYRFEGLRPVTLDINEMSNKMSDGAEALKRDVTSAGKDEDNNHGVSVQA